MTWERLCPASVASHQPACIRTRIFMRHHCEAAGLLHPPLGLQRCWWPSLEAASTLMGGSQQSPFPHKIWRFGKSRHVLHIWSSILICYGEMYGATRDPSLTDKTFKIHMEMQQGQRERNYPLGWSSHRRPRRSKCTVPLWCPSGAQGEETWKCTDSRHENLNQNSDTCSDGVVLMGPLPWPCNHSLYFSK